MLENQSYDHGQEWRLTELVDKNEPIEDGAAWCCGCAHFALYFRIKDSY